MMYAHELPATGLDWKYVFGEVLELLEEIIKLNVNGIINELSDVYTCSMIAFFTSTGISLPILWERTALDWKERVVFWKWYLGSLGLEYKLEYLRYGANYHRRHKRLRVLALAIIDQYNVV